MSRSDDEPLLSGTMPSPVAASPRPTSDYTTSPPTTREPSDESLTRRFQEMSPMQGGAAASKTYEEMQEELHLLQKKNDEAYKRFDEESAKWKEEAEQKVAWAESKAESERQARLGAEAELDRVSRWTPGAPRQNFVMTDPSLVGTGVYDWAKRLGHLVLAPAERECRDAAGKRQVDTSIKLNADKIRGITESFNARNFKTGSILYEPTVDFVKELPLDQILSQMPVDPDTGARPADGVEKVLDLVVHNLKDLRETIRLRREIDQYELCIQEFVKSKLNKAEKKLKRTLQREDDDADDYHRQCAFVDDQAACGS